MTNYVLLQKQEAINNERTVDKAVHCSVVEEIVAENSATVRKFSDMKFMLDNIDSSLNGK